MSEKLYTESEVRELLASLERMRVEHEEAASDPNRSALAGERKWATHLCIEEVKRWAKRCGDEPKDETPAAPVKTSPAPNDTGEQGQVSEDIVDLVEVVATKNALIADLKQKVMDSEEAIAALNTRVGRMAELGKSLLNEAMEAVDDGGYTHADKRGAMRWIRDNGHRRIHNLWLERLTPPPDDGIPF